MRATLAMIGLLSLSVLAEDSSKPELKFNGDMRERGEWYYIDSKEALSSNYPNTERYSQVFRARLGLTASQGPMSAGLRIITGFGAPNTANTTMAEAKTGNSFMSKPIFLDRAFLSLKWQDLQSKTPSWKTQLSFGKMANPLIKPFANTSELIFGNDLAPEGSALNLELGNEHLRAYLNTGRFWVDEIAFDRPGKNDKPDVFLQSQQMVVDLVEDAFKARLGASSHYYNDVKDHVVFGDTTDAKGNMSKLRALTSTDKAKVYTSNFNLVESFVDFSLNTPLPVTLSGSYVRNLEDDSSNTNSGWLAGIKLGAAKKKDQMEISAAFRYAGANSSIGFTSSPDFGLGKTNSMGTIASVRYLLMDYLSADLIWHAYNQYGIRDQDHSDTQNRVRIELNACF